LLKRFAAHDQAQVLAYNSRLKSRNATQDSRGYAKININALAGKVGYLVVNEFENEAGQKGT